jgi:hypothetical protein
MREMIEELLAEKNLERETGFEPATSTLARSHSTAELLPLYATDYKQPATPRQRRARTPCSLSRSVLRLRSRLLHRGIGFGRDLVAHVP